MRDRVASKAVLYHNRNRFVRGSRSTLTYGWKHLSSAAVTIGLDRRVGGRITRRKFRSPAMSPESRNKWTPAGRDKTAGSSRAEAGRPGKPISAHTVQRPSFRNCLRSALIGVFPGYGWRSLSSRERRRL